MKKKIKIIAAIAILVATLGFSVPATYAETDEIQDNPSSFRIEDAGKDDLATDGCRFFLGMTSWDCGLGSKPWLEENLKYTVLKIIINVASDLTILASYLALGFVIYGGYRYLLSGGDVGNTAAGKRVLTHALLGLAIVLCSNIIFNAIRFGLFNNSSSESVKVGGEWITLGNTTGATVFTSAITWVIGMAGVAALIFIVYGGISYITANGDPNKLKKAKDTIIYAAIGLIIVGLAEAITAFISAKVIDASKNGKSAALEAPIVRTISMEEINHEEIA